MAAFGDARKLTVIITGNTAGLNKSFGAAIREAQGFSGKMGVIGSQMKSMMGPALIGAAAAAGAFAIKLGVDAVQAAAAEQKELALLKTSLDNVGQGFAMDEINQFIDDLRFATGVADSELRPAMSKIIGVTKDAASAEKLLAAAVDASVGSGKDLATVSQAIARAAAGSTTSLKKLIPELDATALKSGGVDAVLKALEDRFGGSAAAAAGTFQGQLARLQDGASELQESFGTGVLNALNDTNAAANDLAQTLRDLQPTAEALGSAVGNSISGVVPIWQALGTAVTWVTDNYKNFNVVNQSLLSTVGSMVVGGPLGPLVQMIWGYNAATEAAAESAVVAGKASENELAEGAKKAAREMQLASGQFERAYFTLDEVTAGAGRTSDAMSLLREDIRLATRSLGPLASAFDEANAAMDRRESMQSYRDALKSYIEDPSKETMTAVESAMIDAAQSFTDPKKQAQFTKQAIDDITTAATNAGQKVPSEFDAINSAAAIALDPVSKLKQALLDIPSDIPVTITVTEVTPGGRIIATGGPVFATGGPVRASLGTHASDDVPAMLSRGEYVLNADTVKRLGVGTLNRLNNGGAAGGGMVIQQLNVTAAAGERAEESVPRALRRMAFVAGLNG